MLFILLPFVIPKFGVVTKDVDADADVDVPKSPVSGFDCDWKLG